MSSLPIIVNSFLNNLDEYFPVLLNKYALKIYNDPSIINDFNLIILYNNNYSFLYHFFKYIFDIGYTRETNYDYNDNKIEYLFSDKHLEFQYTEIQFLKLFTRNNTIDKKEKLILIKGLSNLSIDKQKSLKNIIENSYNCKFIILTERLTNINNSLSSMALLCNINFPKENIPLFYNKFYEEFTYHKKFTDNEIIDKYIHNKFDIINLIISIHYNIYSPKINEFIISNFKNIIKEKNCINSIQNIRELVYKIYHVNYPFKYLVSDILSIAKDDIKNQLINIAASCDDYMTTNKKDILGFEKFLIESLNIFIQNKNSIIQQNNQKIIKKKIIKKL